jgi:capsular exopolysaccharide synthesis family protein
LSVPQEDPIPTHRAEQTPEGGSNLPLRLDAVRQLPVRQLQRSLFEQDDEDRIPIEQYLQALRRRKWLLLAVVLTVLALATLQVLTTTPLYQATATIQIDPESQKVLPYEEVASSGAVGGWLLYEYIATQSAKLQSRSLGVRVAKRLRLAENPEFSLPVKRGILRDFLFTLRAAIRTVVAGVAGGTNEQNAPERDLDDAMGSRVAGGVRVRPIKDTRLIEVSFSSPSPRIAAEVSNTTVEEFIEQHLESKFAATVRATDFLRKQLVDLQIQVEKSEEALLKYAQDNNIVNLNERETLNRKRLADLNDQLTQAEAELIAASARFETANGTASVNLPESLKTRSLRDLEGRLSELERQLAGFSSRYGPAWPAVSELRTEIGELEVQLAAERQRAIESVRQDHALAAQRHARLLAAVSEQRRLVDKLNQDSIQYNILKREVDSNKEIYEGLLQRLKEAGVAAGLRSSNIHFANRASVPAAPYYPRRARALLIALILGLFLGILSVFVVETLDNTLKTSDDVTQYFGLPSLGTVPHLAPPETERRKIRLTSRRPSTLSPLIAFGTSPSRGSRRALEAYRSLRTSLLLSHSGKPPQAILITSALPGEGKSTTSVNVAISLAQTGARTLLMDCDMRKPSLAEVFDVSDHKGMSTYLSGNSQLSSQVQETAFSDLFFLPAGPMAPNPAELLGSERMKTGLALMREHFTYIVIDCPPVLEISDSLILSPNVDGVIVVARSEQTPRKAVARAAHQFLNVGATLLGVLINDAELDRHGYGYGSYASYAYYGEDSSDSEEEEELA